jgi:PHD/YefM family antitoxin component YafN of YafNO toxin-antitoxin module
MQVTFTDAKNRLSQMLEDCQREPVVIEAAGRRQGVLLSAGQYDALVAASRAASSAPDSLPSPRTAEEFYALNKEWVDEQNARFERIGIWNEEFRRW